MLSILFLRVKAQQYFVSSSCMFLDKETLLNVWLNPELNLIIFFGGNQATALTAPLIHFAAVHPHELYTLHIRLVYQPAKLDFPKSFI